MTVTTVKRAELARALAAAVDGEVDTSARRRAEYSTDASNYRVPPGAVVMPRDAADLEAALAVARDYGASVTMRGGGTSVAGNSIGEGIVVDTSRHMNRILDLDAEARTARVQPGVVLAALQREAAPHGLRFGPDPSTQSRATLGGMIGNNACGPHAVAHGKTSDNVVRLDLIDGEGRSFVASDDIGTVRGLDAWVAANLGLIRTEFGRFGRQVSGYSLEHLLPENGHSLARFMVGTEGTLAVVTEATVSLVPVAKVRLMGVFGYADMPAAADAVPALLKHRPDAVEGLDARLVQRVRGAKGDAAVPELPRGAGWLFIEVGADTLKAAKATMAKIAKDAGAVDHRVIDDQREAKALWAIRADGAGLSGRTPDGAEAWPGWEDAAVPPDKLGAYLRDFDSLMSRHGLTGQPFGHFGDGCIHVRLDLPLSDRPERMRAFVEEAADLVAGYGGSLSGEHGDGRARGELLERMYSAEAVRAFGEVKHLFDPEALLNPGIVVDPEPVDANLRRPHAPAVPRDGGFAFTEDRGDLTTAVHRCTGVGSCRADGPTTGSAFMCPSYAATKDEKDVTRGRARVLQEAINGSIVGGITADEVLESLDLCLSCKACSSDCPSGVDMAAYKSEVLNRRYEGKVRPMPHYSVGWLPQWLKLIGMAPRVVNAILKPAPIQKAAVWLAGLDTRRTLPVFAAKPFRRSAVARTHRGEPPRGTADRRSLKDRAAGRDAAPEEQTTVVLWADSFTDGIDPQIPTATLRVLEDAGLTVVVVAGDACCGVTWISTGQLGAARKRLDGLLGVLGPWAVNGVPIVGVEPSCTATLRSDLTELLPDDPRAHAVAAGTFTLAEVLTGRAPVKPREGWQPPSLADVTAVVQPHCHQYSTAGFAADRALMQTAGATITEASGCCGLAGNWGTERGHYDTSVKVAENSLLPKLREAPEGSLYIADGISCRTQAEDLAGVTGRHMAELMAERLDAAAAPDAD